MTDLQLFVTGHKGFETQLFHELRSILASYPARLDKVYGGVRINASLAEAYRICLYSRLANRVFCELANARVENDRELYQAVFEIDWQRHMNARSSLAIAATLSRSKLQHRQYVSQVAKDAIVDQFRQLDGSRPQVSKKRPDIQLHINIHQNQATISLDLSGESLHRRGYRLQHAGAPLKEHLAAAMLAQAGWNESAADSMHLYDPMCGSGTFAIEAALIAAARAPGLEREYFGFTRWLQHREDLWHDLVEAARQQIKAAPAPVIHASDYDAGALQIARANAERAGVAHWIEFSHQQIAELQPVTEGVPVLVVCNPPYGKRLSEVEDLGALLDDLGDAVRRLAPAKLALISANPDLLHRVRLSQVQRKAVRNGPLQCLFALFDSDIGEDNAETRTGSTPAIAEAAIPLSNRLSKNARHLKRWATRNQVSCYRLYDADLPEFAFALDYYQSELDPARFWLHLQEYQAPASIDQVVAQARIEQAISAVKQVFELPDDRLFCKVRSRQRGREQYQKLAQRREFFQVREGPASLLINLTDYLDSGLFLDHRPIRAQIYASAAGKHLLNLFCYTASVGVMAGLGGAASVENVDLSDTYLDWARENFRLNRLVEPERYRFAQADIVELLRQPRKILARREYDLIFLDPPSFSNSKRMQNVLDLQRDHAELIAGAMALLARDGVTLFSTNRRGFRLAAQIETDFNCRELGDSTIDEDFRRRPHIHRCWEIRHRDQ